jgi:chromosome segregation ATPase
MSVRESGQLQEHLDALQKQVTHLKDSTDQAREESSAQVRARIEQAKADIAAHQESAQETAGRAAERAQSQWQSMRADAAAKMRDLHDRIDRKRDELDVKAAVDDAEGAEEDAIDALDFAGWAVGQAELAVLDAIDAHAWADERAAASPAS